MTYDLQRRNGVRTNKKLAIMWAVAPTLDFNVNWFALSICKEEASKDLYNNMYKNKNLDTFNRSPSFKDKSAEFTTYDFELGLKVTATMTSFPRAELKIKIRNIAADE